MPQRQLQGLTLSDFLAEVATLRRAVVAGGNVLDAPYKKLDQPALRRLLDFVNSGHYTPGPDDARPPSALILVVDEPLPPGGDVDPEIFRDVDSIIVIKTDFPWEAEYGVFTLWPSPAAMGHLHTQAEFDDENGDRVSRDPGQDYGLWWGSCGPSARYALYIMLPQFADGAAGPPTDLAVSTALYGFLVKAIKYYEPERAAGLAPNYESEKKRAQGFVGSARQSKSTKLVSAEHGSSVANYVMNKLRDLEWGRGAYFLLQIRGVKDITRVRSNDTVRTQILQLLVNVASEDAYVWVDVGLEVHPPPGFGVLPRRDSHQELVELLLHITPEQWAQCKSPSLDVWAGISSVAGGRWSFAANPVTAARISYIQLYTTDKAALYNASTRSKVPTLAGMQVLKLTDAEDRISQVTEVYRVLLEWHRAKTPIVLRLEARVPLAHAVDVFPLADIDLELLRNQIFVLPAENIWAWRLNRTMGLSLLFRMVADADRPARKDTFAVMLVATAVYLYNSLNRTPPNNQHDRDLCLATFETARGRDQVAQTSFYSPHHETTTVPVMTRGAMWLPSVSYTDPAISNVLRVRSPKEIWEPVQIARLFNVAWTEIENLYTRPTGRTPGIMVRDVRTARSIAPRDIDITDNFIMTTNDQVFDHGPDLPVESQHGEVPHEMTAGKLFVTLIVNVFGQIGITKARDLNYMDLNASQRSLVGPNTFRHNSLLTYFPACYWTKSDTAWRTTRDLLFPTLDSQVNYADNQGWKRVPAFRMYCAALERPDGLDVRQLCVEEFDKLLWFPQLDKSKLFEYKARSNGYQQMGSISTNKNRAVAVLWNPKATSNPSTIRDSQAKLDGNALAAFQTLRQEAREALEDASGDVSDEESRPSSPNVEITEVRPVRMPTPTREFLRGVKRKNGHHPGKGYRDDSPRPQAMPRYEEEEGSS
ncbi:hypothetical protein DFH09DRAFT_1105856 [Mycena vulgaris]|nr:hypothetical protein DFH09DRAFT_1105856 [Mycena vulgaris]